MQVKKTSQYVVSFGADEVKEALVYWMSRGSKSTVQTISMATMFNNSECTIEGNKEGTLSISFEWDETDESR